MGTLSRRGFLRASVATGLGASGVGSLAGCLAPTVSGVSGADWPQFRYDPARTGYNSGAVGPDGEVAEQWSFQTDDRSVSTPAVVGGTVFVNSDSFAALDAGDGASKWAKGVFHRSGTAPGVAEDGSERWQLDSNRFVLANPSVTRERVYVAGLLGSIRAVDRADGSEAWSVETQGVVFSSPSVVEDAVYVGGSDRTVYAFG